MKGLVKDFLLRGFVAAGFGPLVLAVVYLILQRTADVNTVTVDQLCTGIFSLTALAFLVGGMNTVYRVERLPLMVAILIHGGVLYIGYLVTYLLNDWLASGLMPIVIFTVVFAVGYLLIWAVIYAITKRNTERINEGLKKKQRSYGQ